MKRTMIVLALVVLLLVSLGGLALAGQPQWYGNDPTLPLRFPHLNSNDTGFFIPEQIGVMGSLVRAVPGQLVHTNFQLDTNSCASCHMTHTAVGDNLLFQRSVTRTCMACHDGTIGVLNVLAPPRAGTAGIERFGGSETAGTFGVDVSAFVYNASIHDVNVAATLSTAPGGNRAAAADSAGMLSGGWDDNLSCVSCHAPHGSYSFRLLHSNPNFLGWRDENPLEGTNFATGGLWNRGNTLLIDTAVTRTHPGVVGIVYDVRVTAAGANITTAPWLYGYVGATTLLANRPVGGHTFLAGVYNRHNTRIYATNLYDPNAVGAAVYGGGPFDSTVDAVYLLNSFFEINYQTGVIGITPGNRAILQAMGADLNTLRIDIARALVVTAVDRGRPFALDHIDTRSYGQLNYNRFCAACHADYLPQGSDNPLRDTAAERAGARPGGYGTYSLAHRHTINRAATVGNRMTVTGAGNQLLCVSCHFAHGADSRMMRRANHTLNDFNAPSVDVNASSALKRYVNQAVCWSCHTNSQAAVFKNTTYYWAGYAANQGYQW